jgi:tetratricopeptide (TPR) repeat protein
LSHELKYPGGIHDRDAESQILDEAKMALECLETGSYLDAKEKVNELAARFSGHETAEFLAMILRRELLRHPEASLPEKGDPEHDPDAASRELARAHALLKQRRDEDARSTLERAHALDPDSVEITDGLVMLLKRMGLESYAEGNSTQAISYWQRVLEVRPGEAETLRFLRRANAASKKS